MKSLYLTRGKFSNEEREKIVKEYLTTDISRNELAKKYEIGAPSCISMWLKAYKEGTKDVSLPQQVQKQKEDTEAMSKVPPTKDEQIAELELQLKEAQEALSAEKKKRENAEMQNLVLNTILDIAAEHGNDLRKKHGVKR